MLVKCVHLKTINTNFKQPCLRYIASLIYTKYVEVVSHCLPPRTIGLERLAQGGTYELISVLYTRLSSTSVYIYVTYPNSYAVRRIMIALMSLPWKNPRIRHCNLLCCS